MATNLSVGIDLGTTNSVAAWVDGSGRTAVVENSDGDLLTPSVVAFVDKRIVVGKEAKKLGVLKPGFVAEAVKRDMGNPFYSRPIDGEYLPPESIQACVLRKLREDITKRIGPDFGVVITVPAFFDEPRRRATAIAGEIAGLHVLDIVNEPVAAALAFSEHMRIFKPGELNTQPMNILVYDLGGGTFDVTVLKINPVGLRTLATDGDVHLGGRDWDAGLAEMVCEEFIRRFREDPRDNPVSAQRLLIEVERAKHTLTARRRTTVSVDHAGSCLETEVTREDFEARSANLLERTAHTTRQLLATAGLAWKDVSHILLSGGSTRMPMVSELLQQESRIKPDTFVSPDEAVARGAAIYAKYLLDLASDSPPKYTITNASAHKLGIQGVELDTGQKVNAVLIPRNTPLPAKTTKTFVTRKEDQRRIAILVLEGESSIPSECTVIGRAMINDLPENLPAGHPVEVTYEYATNGRLHVSARVPNVDCAVDIEIERGARLPDEWIAEWRDVVGGPGGLSAFKKLLRLQRRRERGLWHQLTEAESHPTDDGASESYGVHVEFDEVIVPSGYTEGTPLELDHTTEVVKPRIPQNAEAEGRSTGMSTAYALPVTGRRKRDKRRALGTALEVVKIVVGGLVGLLIAHFVLRWFGVDSPFDFLIR